MKPEYRHEIKFAYPSTGYHNLIMDIRLHPMVFKIAYPSRRVNNVYFDTFDLYTYEQNLSGASERVKVRYRWYGQELFSEQGKLEIKLKKNNLGTKLFYPLSLNPYNKNDNWRNIIQKIKLNINDEGKKWLNNYSHPTLINSYDRDYYISSDKKIRITIDKNQEMYKQIHTTFPNVSQQINIPDIVVMEVKFSPNSYEDVVTMLDLFKARLMRYSKYSHGISTIVNW